MKPALPRRRFLQVSAAVVGGGLLAHPLAASANAPAGGAGVPETPHPLAGEVFAHGVASGDPLPNAVVVWTRVTPSPEAVPGSGLGQATEVQWEMSTKADFDGVRAPAGATGAAQGVVRSGSVLTAAAHDHTVKVDVQGLEPATTYFYRFHVKHGGEWVTSPVGRTRTAPAVEATPERVRFGVCSCSNYEAGYFSAYAEMARRDDLEFVLHLGDYTYEYAAGEYAGRYDTVVRATAPAHRTVSLADFRIRQGLYHRDPDLQALHQSKPLVCIWDDHEFADNAWRVAAAGDSAEPGEDYAAVKAAAAKAYYEWMPVRVKAQQGGTHLYRTLQYGTLMELILPDLRTYRDVALLQTNKRTWMQSDPDFLRNAGDAKRSMMGSEQFAWFSERLRTSPTAWQLVGNSVMMAPMTLPPTMDKRVADWLIDQVGLPDQGIALNTDQWDGFMAERQRIVDLIAASGQDVVMLTGDIHSSWSNELPRSVRETRATGKVAPVATEFVAPSVTANGVFDSIASSPALAGATAQVVQAAQSFLSQLNPWLRWIDFRHHGYMAVEVRADAVQCDWHHTDEVLTRRPAYHLGRSELTRKGSPGIASAPAPLDAGYQAFA